MILCYVQGSSPAGHPKCHRPASCRNPHHGDISDHGGEDGDQCLGRSCWRPDPWWGQGIVPDHRAICPCFVFNQQNRENTNGNGNHHILKLDSTTYGRLDFFVIFVLSPFRLHMLIPHRILNCLLNWIAHYKLIYFPPTKFVTTVII